MSCLKPFFQKNTILRCSSVLGRFGGKDLETPEES